MTISSTLLPGNNKRSALERRDGHVGGGSLLSGGKVSYGDRRSRERTTIHNADINITRPLFLGNNERSTSRNVALVGVVKALVARRRRGNW